jgi:hypothetical protein
MPPRSELETELEELRMERGRLLAAGRHFVGNQRLETLTKMLAAHDDIDAELARQEENSRLEAAETRRRVFAGTIDRLKAERDDALQAGELGFIASMAGLARYKAACSELAAAHKAAGLPVPDCLLPTQVDRRLSEWLAAGMSVITSDLYEIGTIGWHAPVRKPVRDWPAEERRKTDRALNEALSKKG